MKCDTRLLTAESITDKVTSGVKTAPLRELLSASDRKTAGKFAVLLVNVPTADGNTQMFRATLQTKVPVNTDVIRSKEGQLVGIPAVAGG